MQKVKEVILEPGAIGVARKSGRRVWMNVKITVVLSDGSVRTQRYRTMKEATAKASEMMKEGMGDA